MKNGWILRLHSEGKQENSDFKNCEKNSSNFNLSILRLKSKLWEKESEFIEKSLNSENNFRIRKKLQNFVKNGRITKIPNSGKNSRILKKKYQNYEGKNVRFEIKFEFCEKVWILWKI